MPFFKHFKRTPSHFEKATAGAKKKKKAEEEEEQEEEKPFVPQKPLGNRS